MKINSTVQSFVEITRALESGKIKAKFHHYAVAPGYLAKEKRYVEDYQGKYGAGYRVHYGTADNDITRGKNVHIVEYWTTTEGGKG